MFKMLSICAFLITCSSAFAETDTLIFKLRNRIDGTSIDSRNYEIRIDNDDQGLPYQMDIKANLQGESYDNTWLWQTYDFSRAGGKAMVSPKLPAGCVLKFVTIADVFHSTSDFYFKVQLTGKTCVSLRESLAKEKLKILFTDVPVRDENRKKDKLFLLVDDLHHEHMQNPQALTNFATFVNQTDDKTKGTYVAYDFPIPAKFDTCEIITNFETMADLSQITTDACDLKKSCDTLAMISALGELGDRIGEIFDPAGQGKIKRCTLKQQYLTPAPRNGLLKNASSVFYFSLSNDLKMLMQTNAKN